MSEDLCVWGQGERERKELYLNQNHQKTVKRWRREMMRDDGSTERMRRRRRRLGSKEKEKEKREEEEEER